MYCRELNGSEEKNSGTKKLFDFTTNGQCHKTTHWLGNLGLRGSLALVCRGGTLQPVSVMHLCVVSGSKHFLHYTTIPLQSTSLDLFLLLSFLSPIKYPQHVCIYVCLAFVVHDDVFERSISSCVKHTFENVRLAISEMLTTNKISIGSLPALCYW